MRVLALSAQSVVEALAGAALQPRLRRLLVSMETIQPGLKPSLGSRAHEGEGSGEDAVKDGVS